MRVSVSEKLVGSWGSFQAWIPTGERFGLLTRIGTMESVTLRVRDKKLTAFVELEAEIRGE